MRVLVTGGAGFIGSNIVEELLRRDYKVRVIDNLSTGRVENIREFEKEIEFIEGDIRSYHIVEKTVQDVDVILHQAALPSVPRSIGDPITSNDVNVSGTLNLLNAAKDKGVKRFVFASSSSVYGDTLELPKHEEMIPYPMSPYAASKLAGEHYCRVFNRIYGLETIILRYFNVFGPRQNPFSQYAAVIPRFIKFIHDGKSPVVFGDGEQSRDFTYIRNVVEANILAATHPNLNFLIANCATQQKITINELIAYINKFLGTDVKPIYEAPRSGDVKESLASIEKAKNILGYRPLVQFLDGLKLTIDHLVK
ncbi:MAG: SDR family oxidoreductase [Ignavibacteria bacterium]|nr:SDR family oxidoreductase [Ignavibacteria bacterium]